MKKKLFLIYTTLTMIYSLYYANIGGFSGNEGALSKIGLKHHVLFFIWGLLTYSALCFGIKIGFKNTEYKFYKVFLIISGIGMLFTLCFDFDYNKMPDYWLHCIGSLLFSAVMGISVFLLFLLTKRKLMTIASAIILITDTLLLLIFKETAFIELFPIFSGYIMLCVNAIRNERIKVEIN